MSLEMGLGYLRLAIPEVCLDSVQIITDRLKEIMPLAWGCETDRHPSEQRTESHTSRLTGFSGI